MTEVLLDVTTSEIQLLAKEILGKYHVDYTCTTCGLLLLSIYSVCMYIKIFPVIPTDINSIHLLITIIHNLHSVVYTFGIIRL